MPAPAARSPGTNGVSDNEWPGTGKENKIMTAKAGPIRGDPPVTDLVMRARKGEKQGVGRTRRAVRRSFLVDLPPVPTRAAPTPTMSARTSGCTWWNSLTRSAIRPRFLAGSPPPPGANAAGSCAQRAARTLAGMGWTPSIADQQSGDRRGLGAAAVGRAPRSAARGVHPAPRLPAADGPAHRRSSHALRRDQRQAGHPDRQHRRTAAAAWTSCAATRQSLP